MIHKKYLGEFYIWSYIFYVFSLLLIYIRNVLPKFIELCMETPSAVWRRHPDELQHGGRKPTETSVTEFCYKSVNLLLEELLNIKVTRFLTFELFR